MIYINEQHMGGAQHATSEQVKQMIALLSERGYDVEYGDSVRSYESPNDETIKPTDWRECLDEIYS